MCEGPFLKTLDLQFEWLKSWNKTLGSPGPLPWPRHQCHRHHDRLPKTGWDRRCSVLSHHRGCWAPWRSPTHVGPCQRGRGRGWAFSPGWVGAGFWLTAGSGRRSKCKCAASYIIHPQVSEHCASRSTAALQTGSLLSFPTQETCSLAKAVEAYAVKVRPAIPGLGKGTWQHQFPSPRAAPRAPPLQAGARPGRRRSIPPRGWARVPPGAGL